MLACLLLLRAFRASACAGLVHAEPRRTRSAESVEVAPDWLLRFATVQAGSRIDDNGQTVDAAAELAGWEALRAEVNALPADAPFAAWGKWLLADGEKRTFAPGFEITLAGAEARGLVAAPVTIAVVEEAATATSLLR